MAAPAVAAMFAQSLLSSQSSGGGGAIPSGTPIQASAEGPGAGGLIGGAASEASIGDTSLGFSFGDNIAGGSKGAAVPGWVWIAGAALGAIALMRR